MSNAAPSEEKQLEKLRFPSDCQSVLSALAPIEELFAVAAECALNEFPVTEDLIPELEAALSRSLSKLGLNREDVQAYVYPDSNIQASCLPSQDSHCIVRLSSGLVQLLNNREVSFVIGHELAHHVFRHGSTVGGSDQLALEEKVALKHREISADRLGLIACGSLKESISALIKTVSGLDGSHLRLDVNAYIETLSKVDVQDDLGRSMSAQTHPPILIRCRSLLWFFGALGSSCQISHLSQEELELVNQRVLRDLERFVDSAAFNAKEDLVLNYDMWALICRILKEGRFSREGQEEFSTRFGPERLEKVKRFLSSSSPEELRTIAKRKRDSAADEVTRQFPVSGPSLMRLS
ncbi:MAG: M48 family metallopeptidase [Xanthomonadales bacterium]|nr:M48 family metallopeptidase [Xanthomonadales bacterium]